MKMSDRRIKIMKNTKCETNRFSYIYIEKEQWHEIVKNNM